MHGILQFFAHAHLREDLRPISQKFYELAYWIDEELPVSPERTMALRKLLEAKDCAVRAKLYKHEEDAWPLTPPTPQPSAPASSQEPEPSPGSR